MEEAGTMKEKTYNTFRCWNRFFIPLAAILMLISQIGCVTDGTSGKMEGSRDLNTMFLNYEVLPDHRYYTSGGYDAPDAILAIHTDYVLDNQGNLWVPIPNVDYAQMRKWIDTIAPEQNYRFGGYSASYILNPEGKRVGAWYSIQSIASVKFLEGKKIFVYTPDVGIGIDIGRGLRRGL